MTELVCHMILILYTNLGRPYCLHCAVCQWGIYQLKSVKTAVLTYIAVVFCPTHTGSYISPFAKNASEATILLYTNMAAFFLCILKGDDIIDNTAIITYTEVVFCPLQRLLEASFSICHKATVSLYTNMAAVFHISFPKDDDTT